MRMRESEQGPGSPGQMVAAALAAAMLLGLLVVAAVNGAWATVVIAVLSALAGGGLVFFAVRPTMHRARTELESARQLHTDLIEFPPQAVFIATPDGQFTHVGSRWTEWTGMDAGEAAAGRWTEAVHPDDRATVVAAWANAVASGVDSEQEYRLLFTSNRYRWIRSIATPVRHADGSIRSWHGMFEDVHERRVAEEQLRQTSSLLEMIGTSTDSVMYVKDREGRLIYANRALERLAGVSLAEILGKTDLEWNADPLEAQAFRTADLRVMESGRSEDLEEVFTGRSGTPRYYRSMKSPLRDRSGAIIGVFGVSTDFTDKREADLREKLLTRELDHRAKNLLAVVQSVVALTRAPTVSAFKSAVEGRIHALGRTHAMLSASRWEGADLQRIVRDEMAGFAGSEGRFHLSGPPVLLKPVVAQSLSLIIHELASNAVAHGAMSSPGGEVSVHWKTAERGGLPGLSLSWRERGGPPVKAPRNDGGFGLKLIRNSVERQLAGNIAIDFAETGFVANFDVLLDRAPPAAGGSVPSKRTPRTRRLRSEGGASRSGDQAAA